MADVTSDADGRSFVGRQNDITTLTERMRRSSGSPTPKLRIISISGPGGIGKSFLLRHVETSSDVVRSERYLRLELQGTGSPRSTARMITTDLVQSAAGLDAAQAFPRLLKLRETLAHIDDIAREELRKLDPEFSEWVTALYSLGVGALSLHSDTKALAKVLGKVGDKNVERFAKLIEQSYKSERGVWGWRPSRGFRNRVRTNILGHLAAGLIDDLRDLVDSQNYERLLLVFDDYESLEPVLGTFLVDELLPRVRDEPYQSTIVTMGRDRLRDTNASWKQHYALNLTDDIELKQLTRHEAEGLIRSRIGVADEEVVQRILTDTECYPYLIDSEVEDALTGGGTALSLRNFVDRTTRWMSPLQKEWMQALCFLDVVNEDSIAEVLPDEVPSAVLDWFERESSIRSPHTKKYAVLPIIRSRVMAYVQNRSPKKYSKLSEAAARATSATTGGGVV